GFRVLRDRSPLDAPVAESDYPVLMLRCTNDLAGQFADALSVFCAQPLVYTTPAGTEVTVDLPRRLLEAMTGIRVSTSSAIQATAGATALTTTADDATEEDGAGDGVSPRDLWIAL